MNRRDFSIGAILALLCTGANMTPDTERRAITALERCAKALEELARNDRHRTTVTFKPVLKEQGVDFTEGIWREKYWR